MQGKYLQRHIFFSQCRRCFSVEGVHSRSTKYVVQPYVYLYSRICISTRTCIFLNILIHILFRHWVFTFWFLIQNTLFNHEFWYTQFVCVHSTNIVSILLEATKNVPRVTESFILIRDISTKIILNLLIIYFSILIIPRQRNMKNGRNSTLTTLIFRYTALTNKLSYKYSSCEIVLQPRAKLLHNSS